MDYAPDGRRLVAPSSSGLLNVWDARDLAIERTLGVDGASLPDREEVAQDRPLGLPPPAAGPAAIAVDMGPDGLVAAAIRNGTIHVRDAATGRGGFDATMEASIYDLAWSPSGDVLAVAAGDATHGWVTVTDRSGRRRATLQAEPGVAFQTVAFTHDGGAATGSVAFSPGGSQLASVGADGLVRIWALDVEDAVAIAEREVTRTLTDAECRQYLHTDRCPRA